PRRSSDLDRYAPRRCDGASSGACSRRWRASGRRSESAAWTSPRWAGRRAIRIPPSCLGRLVRRAGPAMQTDLVNAPAFGFENLDVESIEREPLAHRRHAADLRQDEPADGLEGALLDLETQALAHLANPHLRAEDERVVRLTHDGLDVAVVLVVNLAHQFLDDVFDGDEPRCAAVLVDHHGLLQASLLELAQQVDHALGLGHE